MVVDDVLVITVDENDRETGVMEKMEAHRKGVLHRAVSVFVFNNKGEWLLQQRAAGKYHSAELWSNTCCSHPYPNEDYLQAAERRLMEEMGISAKLQSSFLFRYKVALDNNLVENEMDNVFFAFTDDLPVTNPQEVQGYRYLSSDKLKKEIQHYPERFTEWFKLMFDQVLSKLES